MATAAGPEGDVSLKRWGCAGRSSDRGCSARRRAVAGERRRDVRRFQGILLLAVLTAFLAADRSRPALAQPAADGLQPTYWAKREGFISLNQEKLKTLVEQCL